MNLAIAQQQQIGGRPVAVPEPAESKSARLFRLAEAELGKRYAGPVISEPDSYRWGDPGWDCSSFVSGMYDRAFGIKLTAYTDAIYGETIPAIPPFMPGDILLYAYADSSQPGVRFPHTGLWVSPETVLDARYGAGQGVGYHPHVRGAIQYLRRPVGFTWDDAPTPGGLTELLDTTGHDILPYLRDASTRYDIPAFVLAALCKAESGLNPAAAREGVWPDVSYGLSQMTVATAAGYDIGDGSDSSANRAVVKALLLDRRTSINLGARHYAGNVAFVRARHPGESGDALWLNALRVYNGGGGALDNPDWERRWGGNVANYRAALEWAHEVFGE
jgi:hypothetical protein